MKWSEYMVGLNQYLCKFVSHVSSLPWNVYYRRDPELMEIGGGFGGRWKDWIGNWIGDSRDKWMNITKVVFSIS